MPISRNSDLANEELNNLDYNGSNWSFSSGSKAHLLILIALFIFAFSLRLCHFNDPLLTFHPTRQYRSALIAKAFYMPNNEIAQLNLSKEGLLEPPISETICVAGYHILGREDLRLPRLLSSIYWMVGGVFLYFLCRRLFSSDGALLAVAFYLLSSYGVMSSRSFQPDPLMIAFMCMSLAAVYWYHGSPSRSKLLLASVASASAVFIKPVCLFVILAAFFALALQRGKWKNIVNASTLLFVGLTLLPTAIYFVVTYLSSGPMAGQASGSFLPHLVTHGYFWKGWLMQIKRVFGLTTVLAALVSVILVRPQHRVFVLSLWFGYLAFGLTFTYHIHTHDYYQMQLIPIIAISFGALGELVAKALFTKANTKLWRSAVWLVTTAALICSASVIPQLAAPTWPNIVSAYKEIGKVVDHTDRAIILDRDYGKLLKYHAEVSGQVWPLGPVSQTVNKLEEIQRRFQPHYFIAANLEELEQQPVLLEYLNKHASAIKRGDTYRIFDLRTKTD